MHCRYLLLCFDLYVDVGEGVNILLITEIDILPLYEISFFSCVEVVQFTLHSPYSNRTFN